MSEKSKLLEVSHLSVEFETFGGTVRAVRDVSFQLERGETLAIVGESGCGKSVTAQAVMGLVDMPPGRITAGSAKLSGDELIGSGIRELNRIRGTGMAMVFQDPMSSLNPTMRIGDQIAETLIAHNRASRTAAAEEATLLLMQTGITDSEKRARQYPFELSGGMLQRAMIAICLAGKPKLLIADEPTTALDVTTQSQVLELIRKLQQEHRMGVLLITHDLGVVARMADRVAVMYAGEIIETGSVDDIFYRTAHPYTLGLRDALPSPDKPKHRLAAIPGVPPDLFAPPTGCSFAPRCPNTMQICESISPESIITQTGHSANCWLQHSSAPNSAPRIARLQTTSHDVN